MVTTGKNLSRRAAQAAKPAVNAVAGNVAAVLLRAIRYCNRVFISNVAGSTMRGIGPWLREQRVGRANLQAAFPEKSPREIDAILKGVWDNLGRVGAEIAHLDTICAGDDTRLAYIDFTPAMLERFLQLRDDGKPTLVFAAHTANWELPAVIAARYGLKTAVLYRRPNLGAIADAVIALRRGLMGELVASSMGAPVALARALENGMHVAMLVDQHYGRGVEVTFFGRKCMTNPLIAMLARQLECPIRGTRVIRLPGNRFAGEITDEIPPVRDPDGRINVAATMQAITDVIEGWVREHPEQWLWVHRRWR